MKYEIGEVVSGERLPKVREMFGDRRDGMWMWLMQGDDMVVLVPTSSMEPQVLDILDRSEYDKEVKSYAFMKAWDRKHNIWSREQRKILVETAHHGKQEVTSLLPELGAHSTLHDAAMHWAASNIMPCNNKIEFGAFFDLWSREWNEVSHAILLSDWDHVDTVTERWWLGFSPLENHDHNELARNAVWWGQMMLSAEPVTTETELF